MNIPEIGKPAPHFRLKGPGGAFVSLSDYIGHRNVVLVFFPLAFSPVCSHQLPEIQRHIDRFRELDTEVFGVSIDSHYANEAFARSLGLEYALLSDFRARGDGGLRRAQSKAGYSGRAVFVHRQGRPAHLPGRQHEPGDLSQIPSPERMLEALRVVRA